MKSEELVTTSTPQTDQWQGYTLEDLRYRRAYLAARCDLQKERMLHSVAAMKNGTASSAANIARKAASAIPAFNYALLAWNIGSRAFKVLGKLRGHKKKK